MNTNTSERQIKKLQYIVAKYNHIIGTNTTYATEQTFLESRQLQRNHRQDKNLQTIESSIDLFNKFKGIAKENALKNVTALDCGKHQSLLMTKEYCTLGYIVPVLCQILW